MKVLIIEDDQEVVKRIRAGLDRLVPGTFEELIDANDPRAAMSALRMDPNVSLIVLDGCLTGEHPDGLGLLPDIRELYPAPRPILAISKSSEMRELMMERGCTHECDKKFAVGMMLKILNLK
ncbi:MAG: hypothetical protein V4465_01480 [Patescibacteria group bacterium]